VKRRNFRFPVSPGSAEALVRWGGKIKYILIAYFFRNICVKNYHNRTVYVKIIASCKGGTFLRHGVDYQNLCFWSRRHEIMQILDCRDGVTLWKQRHDKRVLKLKNGSNTGSDTLTRDLTWPDPAKIADPATRESVTLSYGTLPHL